MTRSYRIRIVLGLVSHALSGVIASHWTYDESSLATCGSALNPCGPSYWSVLDPSCDAANYDQSPINIGMYTN
jgi:carbonic anhydrase